MSKFDTSWNKLGWKLEVGKLEALHPGPHPSNKLEDSSVQAGEF